MDHSADPLLKDIAYLSGLLLAVKVVDICLKAYEKRKGYDSEEHMDGAQAGKKSLKEWLKKLDL